MNVSHDPALLKPKTFHIRGAAVYKLCSEAVFKTCVKGLITIVLSLIYSNFSSLSRAAPTTLLFTDTTNQFPPIHFHVQQRLLDSPRLALFHSHKAIWCHAPSGATYISQWANTESLFLLFGRCFHAISISPFFDKLLFLWLHRNVNFRIYLFPYILITIFNVRSVAWAIGLKLGLMVMYFCCCGNEPRLQTSETRF